MAVLAGSALKAGGFTVDLKMRRFFLDRARVLDRIGKLKAKTLGKAGHYTRQAARKLLGRPSKKAYPRPAGQPPRVHTDDERATLRNVLYHYNEPTDSVIVGPVHLNQVQQNAIDLGTFTVPEIQEFGGEVMIREESYNKGQTWWRRDLRRNLRPWYLYRERRATYPARPFMGPALKKTIARLPELFGFDFRGQQLFGPN